MAMIKKIISTLDPVTYRTMVTLYVSTDPGAPSKQTDLEYADIIPSGVTGTPLLYITKWSIVTWNGPQSGYTGQQTILHESPAESGAWKMTLWKKDGEPFQKIDDFNPPQIFSDGDELCLVDQSGNSNNAYATSYIVNYYIEP